MLAANFKPKEILRARYDIVSINTNNGNKPKGQPAGTKKAKNFNPCSLNPNKDSCVNHHSLEEILV